IYVASVSIYYALDSFLADPWNQYTSQVFYPIPTSPHRYYVDIQSQGGVYTPFQDLATYRTQPKSSLIYSVWRLDGTTKDIAKSLVDKAIAAQGNLTGQACFDRRFSDDVLFNSGDWGYVAGDWDLHRAAEFAALAGFT